MHLTSAVVVEAAGGGAEASLHLLQRLASRLLDLVEDVLMQLLPTAQQ